MNELRELILNITQDIHGYRYHEALSSVSQLVEALTTWNSDHELESMSVVKSVNETLEHINRAIEDKDYLRMADLLEYELLFVLETIENPKEELQ